MIDQLYVFPSEINSFVLDFKMDRDQSFGTPISSDSYQAQLSCAQPIHRGVHAEQSDLDLNLFDDPRDRHDVKEDLNDQLESFRNQWHSELQNPSSDGNAQGQVTQPLTDSEALDEKAKALYLQGMELEENHMLMEAIDCYKKALHLVPDIEKRLAPLFAQSPRPRERARQDSESSYEGSEIDENLLTHFENLCVDDKALCHPAYEQRMTHISALPVELVMYILQWVVSSNLDLRSLENISQVCRGFYLCAKDEQIWKMACDKVWPKNSGSTKKYGGSWRRMIIERSRPLFDGCYISRMSYLRQGEQTMNQFYRPCHIVQYFRYIRFFPDGFVKMMVSSDDPMQSLPKLRYKASRAEGQLIGGYRLSENLVTCVLKRVRSEPYDYKYKRQRRGPVSDKHVYYADLELSPSGKKTNAKLTWRKFSCCSLHKETGEESVTNFNLSKSSFPPMVFSFVTSYCSVSTEPLLP